MFAERERSLSIVVQRTQQHFFSDLFKALKNKSMITPPSLAQLAPYIDDNYIVRVGGRLRFSSTSYDAKHPILLPRSSHLTTTTCHFCTVDQNWYYRCYVKNIGSCRVVSQFNVLFLRAFRAPVIRPSSPNRLWLIYRLTECNLIDLFRTLA